MGFLAKVWPFSPKQCTYFLAVIVALSYFVMNFLDVEDGHTLFTRVNYLEGTSVFIYYNGYISFPQHSFAYLLSFTTPFFQAFGYMLFALLSFLYLITLLQKLVKNDFLVLIFVAYLASFLSLHFYSLTNSIWQQVIITALLPAVIMKNNESYLGSSKYVIFEIFGSCFIFCIVKHISDYMMLRIVCEHSCAFTIFAL